MKKKQGFFSGLKKSTIITMVSCGSFVVMTFLALLFFVKFPIKPSERIISSMGRESIYKQNISYSQTTIPAQTTTETTSKQTTTASTTHKEFIITITTGKGFKTEVKGHDVPVMDYDYDYDYNYDYNYNYDEKTTTTIKTTADEDEEDYNYQYGYDYEDGYNYDYGTDYNYDWSE